MRGNTCGRMRELRTASGSRHITTSPSGLSSSGIQPCSITNSGFSAPCSASTRMRPLLNGSYGTPKNFDSEGPTCAGRIE